MRIHGMIGVAPDARRKGAARRRLASLTQATLLATSVAGPLWHLPAMAEQTDAAATATRQYDVQAGTLDQAINQFATQAGIAVAVDGALTAGKRSEGLSGRYGVDAGLQRLLSGSGLQAVRSQAGVYTLRAAPRDEVSALQEIVVRAQRQDVTTEGSGSYATSASSLMKGTQSLRETPQSISVITRQRMEDQNLQTFEQVMESAPGIVRQNRNFGHSVYYSRGFSVANYQVDGIPMGDYGGVGSDPDMVIYDRVEILRGAPGLLVGTGTPGGTVSFARKRPQSERQIGMALQGGSWQNYRAELDAGGPLNEAGTVRGRVVAAAGSQHYFYDITKQRHYTMYGVLEADLGAATKATVGVSHSRFEVDGRFIIGLPRDSNGKDVGLPRSTSLAVPWARYFHTNTYVFGELQHQFNQDWRFKLTAQKSRRIRDDEIAYVRSAVDPATHTVGRWSYDIERGETNTTALDLNLNGQFQAWGQRHELVLGWSSQRERYAGGSDAFSEDGRETALVDVFNPQQHRVPKPAIIPGTETYLSNSRQHGLYGTLRLKVTDPLTFVLGGRMSWVRADSYRHNSEFTPYAGVVYDVSRDWSVYASYADIFSPQASSYRADGGVLDPIIGANYEIGLKGDILDGRATASLAVFRIDQKNRSQVDPDYPTNCPGAPTRTGACYLSTGKVRSQGFELEFNGEIAKGWQLAAGYTYLTSKYLRDRTASGAPSANEGKTLSAHSPRHLVRVWTNYRLPGDLQRWDVGGGVTLQSGTFAMSGNTRISGPGYAVWNARVGYRFNNDWSAALNVNNVFDKVYYRGSVSSLNNWYGEPRSMMLTLRGRF